MDNLSSSDLRLSCADDLIVGVELINRLLGLRIPVPALSKWDSNLLSEVKFRDPDLLFAHLLGAIFDKNLTADNEWIPLMSSFENFFDKTYPISMSFPFSTIAAELSEERLISEILRTMDVHRLDLDTVFSKDNYIFVKINHAHWEYLAVKSFKSTGKELHRKFGGFKYFSLGWCDELLIHCLRLTQKQIGIKGHSNGCFLTDDFSLGISFNNGDGYFQEDLVTPILPIMRGAMIGCYGFFKGLFPSPSYTFSDGAFSKMLVWRNELEVFFGTLMQRSEVIVFIGPDHLRGMQLREWHGASHNIVIPSVRVHEFWPSVLPVVIAQLSAIFEKHKKVSILVQAGLMSVPLGIAVNQMRLLYRETNIFYFDMGQVLDLASYPDDPLGSWGKQFEIQDLLIENGGFPVFLEKDQ